MIKQRTITAAEMRGINRSAILEIVRRENPIARTTIARQLISVAHRDAYCR